MFANDLWTLLEDSVGKVQSGNERKKYMKEMDTSSFNVNFTRSFSARSVTSFYSTRQVINARTADTLVTRNATRKL